MKSLLFKNGKAKSKRVLYKQQQKMLQEQTQNC